MKDNNFFLTFKVWISKYQQIILLLLIISLGIFLRLFNLGKECLWFDEAVTYYRAILNFSAIIKNSYRWDVHPPTYYLIIHFIVHLSKSETALRLFSALCGIASLPLFYYLNFRILGKREAFISTLLLAISVFHIRYSQEARVYSLFFLVSLFSFLFFYKALIYQNKRHWLVWAGISILNFYIHYFSLVLLTSQIILYIFYLIFTKNVKLSFKYQQWFFYAFLLILIGHIPQLFLFFHQVASKLNASTSYHHTIHPLYFVLIFGKNMINPVELPILFIDRNIKYFIGIFIFSGILTGWKKYKNVFLYNIFIIFISLILGWLSSLLIYFGSGYRFLIFLIIPYLLLLTSSAISLADIIARSWVKIFKVKKEKKIHTVQKIGIMGVLTLLVGININILYYYSNPKKPNWEQGISTLSKYNSENTTIISLPEWGDYAVRYYLSKLSYDKPTVRRIKINSISKMDSLSSQYINLIFTTDGLLPASEFTKKINKWLTYNATLIWQDSYFPSSTIWLVNKKTDVISF